MKPNRWIVFTLLAVGAVTAREVRIEHQRGYVSAQFIFDIEYRPTPQCHASTLVETGDGLLAAWFGGTEEGKADVGIWCARYHGGRWSEPWPIADGVTGESRYPCWNPVLFQPQNGPLMLFYKVGPNPREWWAMLKTSTDDGHTWSPAQRLPDGILGPIKNKPLQLADGTLLCGSSSENNGWEIFFQTTADLGKKWKTIKVPKPKSWQVIQPTLLVYKNGSIHALCRTQQGFLAETASADGGQTWSYLARTKLPNPNSGIDAVTLRDRRHLLVYNHSKTARTPLNVSLGNKKGTTWKRVMRLEDAAGEYSYPAIIQTADGMVHITYTWNRQTIKHVVIDPSKL